MEILICSNAISASRLTARLIGDTLSRNPLAVLGLATGRTVVPLYNELVRMHHEESLNFSNCHSFNLDEYVGLSRNDPDSFRHTMDVQLFDRVNIKYNNTHVLNGVANDLDAECEAYEQCIRSLGGIDFQLLGIGNNGHIGFNEPLSAFQSKTRVTTLASQTMKQNSGGFSLADRMPQQALTMGIGTILDSQRCVLLATGEAKAIIVSKAIEGPITSMIPASALQFHPKCQIVLDEMAAGKLKDLDHYRWVFENEPKWKQFRDIGKGR